MRRVEKAREAQEDAQKQFKDALQEFQALVGYDGGDLEGMYKKVSDEYDDSKKREDEVHDKIRNVQKVADSLFREWETEIGQFQNAEYKRISERELRDTRTRYEELVGVMEKGASKMDPSSRSSTTRCFS